MQIGRNRVGRTQEQLVVLTSRLDSLPQNPPVLSTLGVQLPSRHHRFHHCFQRATVPSAPLRWRVFPRKHCAL